MTRREERVRRRVAILALLTVAALMTVCAGAQAKTVQVGSPLNAASTLRFNSLAASTRTAAFHSPRPWSRRRCRNPRTHLSSPVDGTVISYRVVATDGTFAIQVVRLSAGLGQSIATSDAQHLHLRRRFVADCRQPGDQKGDSVGIRNFLRVGPVADSLGWMYLERGQADDLVSGPCRRRSSPAHAGTVSGPGIPPGPQIPMQATVRYCKVPRPGGQ